MFYVQFIGKNALPINTENEESRESRDINSYYWHKRVDSDVYGYRKYGDSIEVKDTTYVPCDKFSVIAFGNASAAESDDYMNRISHKMFVWNNMSVKTSDTIKNMYEKHTKSAYEDEDVILYVCLRDDEWWKPECSYVPVETTFSLEEQAKKKNRRGKKKKTEFF